MDEKYMKMAIELSKKAIGHTAPNPIVGCVVVKDGEIVSTGYHEKIGGFHAERNALLKVGDEARGADLYVTLEPCCHHGKTPPCTDIIIEKGIKRVIMGAHDPNPKVDGGGIKVLEANGIEVITGVMEDECMRANEVFMHYMTAKRPFVALKYAMTLDGKIATRTGDSKWVTGEKAREHTHYLRNMYSAILVGIGTVLADDPMLNCRIDGGVDPVRIICDNNFRLPLDSRIAKTADKIKTIVVGCKEGAAGVCDEAGKTNDVAENENTKAQRMEMLSKQGIDIILLDNKNDISLLLDELYKREIDSVLIEGGCGIHGSFVDSGLVDRVYAYIAPKIVGGADALGVVGGCGKEMMRDAFAMENIDIMRFGEDICITGTPKR